MYHAARIPCGGASPHHSQALQRFGCWCHSLPPQAAPCQDCKAYVCLELLPGVPQCYWWSHFLHLKFQIKWPAHLSRKPQNPPIASKKSHHLEALHHQVASVSHLTAAGWRLILMAWLRLFSANSISRDSWMLLPQWGLITPSLDWLRTSWNILEHRSTERVFAIHSELCAPCHSPCPCGFRICTIRKYSPEVTSGATVCKSKTEYLREPVHQTSEMPRRVRPVCIILDHIYIQSSAWFRRLQPFWIYGWTYPNIAITLMIICSAVTD